MNNETTKPSNTIDGPPEMASDVRPPKNFGRIDPSLPFNDQDFATDSAGAIRRAILHVLVENGFWTLDEIFDRVERFAKESNDSNGLKIDDIESVDLFEGDVDYLAKFFKVDEVVFFECWGGDTSKFCQKHGYSDCREDRESERKEIRTEKLRDKFRAVNSFEAALEDLDRAGKIVTRRDYAIESAPGETLGFRYAIKVDDARLRPEELIDALGLIAKDYPKGGRDFQIFNQARNLLQVLTAQSREKRTEEVVRKAEGSSQEWSKLWAILDVAHLPRELGGKFLIDGGPVASRLDEMWKEMKDDTRAGE